MPAGMYGADPEQLSALGSKLVAQNEAIAADPVGRARRRSPGTTWQGPARDQFEAEWNDQFNPALNALKDAFDRRRQRVRSQRADVAEQVMGVVA